MNIHIIEMPLDYGGKRHGSDMGPSAIRLAGLHKKIESLGHSIIKDDSPVEIIPQEYADIGTNPKAKFLHPIKNACEGLAKKIHKIADENEFPLILGGDHSIVLGTLAGLNASYKNKSKRLGVLYVDAHGDFNTAETSTTGNIHGECLSASAGYGLEELVNIYEPGKKIDAKNICYVGVRDLDNEEKKLMKEAGVTVFTISDIDRLGFSEVLKKIKIFFKTRCDTVHISFDMDSLDPSIAPGTGIPVPGGLNYREALLLMEEMSSLNMVTSMEVVELNPILDVKNDTAVMAVSLIARLLGEKLY